MTDSTSEHPVTALMVEDEGALRRAIEEGLSMFGIQVHGVGNAADFRERQRAAVFDLAIVDLGLPDDDGLSLVRELTDQPDGPGVIILTAASDTDDRIKGFASGADLYFTKPVDVRELALAAIRLAKRLRRPFHESPSAPLEAEPAAWTLRPSQWALESPTGIRVSLTTKELAFMGVLASAAFATVTRAQVLDKLGYADDDAGNRSLDALVRRLRIKAEESLGGSLPVRTVHGIGYAFSGALKAG